MTGLLVQFHSILSTLAGSEKNSLAVELLNVPLAINGLCLPFVAGQVSDKISLSSPKSNNFNMRS